MYNEKIEALIKAALADGVLTEKEKQILFKRAQEEGIDLDEFEMVLDARLIELQKESKKQQTSTPKSNKLGDVCKCPACGAIISSGIAVCQECGYAFTEAASIVSRDKLYNQLLQIENEYKAESIQDNIKRMISGQTAKKSTILKATTISNFPVPNTKADLLDFLSFLVTLANPAGPKDYTEGLNHEVENLGYAYWVLYSSCVNKAKISFAKDPNFTPFFVKYEELLTASKKFRLSKKAKTIIGIAAIYVLLFIVLFLFWDEITNLYGAIQ